LLPLSPPSLLLGLRVFAGSPTRHASFFTFPVMSWCSVTFFLSGPAPPKSGRLFPLKLLSLQHSFSHDPIHRFVPLPLLQPFSFSVSRGPWTPLLTSPYLDARGASWSKTSVSFEPAPLFFYHSFFFSTVPNDLQE